jgi:RimJ/RimL family protein N-acetyltransferase
MNIQSVPLEHAAIRLSPIRADQWFALWEIAKDTHEDIFRWFPYSMHSAEDFRNWMDRSIAEQERGESLVFVTIERVSGELVGSTRFMNIDRTNGRVEIGSTWIVPKCQRTAVNSAAKYLMLRHAFETWKCIRVELKTDALNLKSRNAIAGIGAKEEGTLRRHLVTWSGRVRDTVYFSILDDEWPELKTKLEYRLRSGS